MDINVNVKFEKAVIDFLTAITSTISKRVTNNVTVVKESAPKKNSEKPAEKTKPVEETNITIDDIRKALKELKDKKDSAAAKELLTQLGYARVSDIKPESYESVLEKIKGAA